MTFIDEIYDFNLKAGLLDNPYDDFLESSFQIEEALEGLNAHLVANVLTNGAYGIEPNPNQATPKEVSRLLVSLALAKDPFDGSGNYLDKVVLTDVERLDKAIDAIVFAVGSIAKLKLAPEQIARAISVVTTANLQKLSMPKDEFGKLQKPTDFVGPETKLQEILDERTTR